MRESWVQSVGWEGPLEEGMAPHSSVLAWRIPWTEEPGGLQSMGLERVRHDWANEPTNAQGWSSLLKSSPPHPHTYTTTITFPKHLLSAKCSFYWKKKKKRKTGNAFLKSVVLCSGKFPLTLNFRFWPESWCPEMLPRQGPPLLSTSHLTLKSRCLYGCNQEV